MTNIVYAILNIVKYVARVVIVKTTVNKIAAPVTPKEQNVTLICALIASEKNKII